MSYRPKLLALSAAMLLTACAAQPASQVASAGTTSEVKPAYGTCLRETGTRIHLPPGACVATPGRVYTQEEIGNAGAISMGEILYRLGTY